MKKIYKILVYIFFGIFIFVGIGCSSSINSNSDNLNFSEIIESINKLKFDDKTVTYDGKEHSILIDGDLPENISVAYVNNYKVNAGEYTVTAIFVSTNGANISLPTKEARLTILKAEIKDIYLKDATFSYDGKEHSVCIDGILPDGVTVSYTNNTQKNEGNYKVTAHFNDLTGNYIVPGDLVCNLKIIKDGKFHDLRIIYDDNNIEESVVNHGYVVDSLKIDKSNVDGYSYFYINEKTNEKISFPYIVTEDTVLKYVYDVSTFKVNYYYNNQLQFTEIVRYNEKYTFISSYVNDNGLTLVKLLINGSEINPGTSNKFTYLEDINVIMVFKTVSSDFNYTIDENGNATITKYDGNDVNINIPEYVGSNNIFYKVICIGYKAFQNKYNILTVSFPDTLDEIDMHAFDGCSSLNNVILPLYLTTLNAYSFANCTSLTFIEIPSSVIYLWISSFEGCTSLSKVIIKDGVSEIGEGAFRNCTNLKEVEIPKSIKIIPDFCFVNCTSLKTVKLNYGLEKIGYRAFGGCESLESISIPDSVLELDIGVFSGCINLVDIELPNKITLISASLFYGCKNLKSIIIPDDVILIDEFAFRDCFSLEEIIFSKNLINIEDNAFCSCRSLVSLVLNNPLEKIGENAFQQCSKLKEIILPSSLVTIEEWAFYNCDSLLEVIVPEGIVSIFDYTFAACDNLKSIYFPSSIKNFGLNVLQGDKKLNKIVLPFIGQNYDGSGETYFEYLFGADSQSGNYECVPQELKTVEITNCKVIDDLAFSWCDKIENIILPEGLENIGLYAFIGCESLKSITIPKSVIYINNYAFNACYDLVINVYYSEKPVGWEENWFGHATVNYGYLE